MLQAIRQINVTFPEVDLTITDVKKFLQKFGLNEDQDISYSQFLAATLTQKHLETDNIKQLFDYLDIFETGQINKDTLLKTFQRKGRNIEES